jgi:hypothetical protein
MAAKSKSRKASKAKTVAAKIKLPVPFKSAPVPATIKRTMIRAAVECEIGSTGKGMVYDVIAASTKEACQLAADTYRKITKSKFATAIMFAMEGIPPSSPRCEPLYVMVGNE